MSEIQTHQERTPHDLGRLVFTCGDIGRLKVIDSTLVVAGDSYEADMVGAFKLSPLRRGLVLDSQLDIFTFYVPHRHTYGQEFVDFLKAGHAAPPLSSMLCGNLPEDASFLGTVLTANFSVPKWLGQGYMNIYNNYFKMPSIPEAYSNDFTTWSQPERLNGLPCCHLKNIWTATLPDNVASSRQAVAVTGNNVELFTLNAAMGQLHTEQERQLFAQRYRDVVESFGGSTSFDADSRPRLLQRTSQWASGYDIDGTSQEVMGQHTGRVQQSIEHKVPRFFCPEHGAIITVALCRFPPVHTKAVRYEVGQSSHTYADIAGDAAIVGNEPPRDITTQYLFFDGSNANTLKFSAGQHLRAVPDHVDPRYTAIEGFPFLNTTPTDIVTATYVAPTEYSPCFQSDTLYQWNAQLRTNVTVLRGLPTVRDSIMVS